MAISKDARVNAFLDGLSLLGGELPTIVRRLREIVARVCPGVAERMMYGGIMFSGGADFGGVFVSKGHVSFEFSQGNAFRDPEGLLEGSGKFRRHLKFRTVADVDPKAVAFFVRQAVDGANRGGSASK